MWVPDAAHEALRDLFVQGRRRSETNCGHGTAGKVSPQPGAATSGENDGVDATVSGLDQRREVKFEQFAQRATLEDYLKEVEHCGQRITRLEEAIDKAVEVAPATMKGRSWRHCRHYEE